MRQKQKRLFRVIWIRSIRLCRSLFKKIGNEIEEKSSRCYGFITPFTVEPRSRRPGLSEYYKESDAFINRA